MGSHSRARDCKTYPRCRIRPYPSRALLVEGRQPVTLVWWSKREARPEIRQAVPGQMRKDAFACAAPAGFGLVSRTPGRLRDPPWGHYDPCARCSLTARPDRRDTQARPGAESSAKAGGESRSRAPRGAPARVMGRSSPAIRRSVRSRDGPPGAALPHQRLSALCSPHFFGGAEQGQGAPAPSQTGGGALAV